MKKRIFIFSLLFLIGSNLRAQEEYNYSDDLLTISFKAFQSVDSEMAYHILPFLRARFATELADTSSFSNPFDSLSQYIGIKYTQDSLLKTYCWSERNETCCHTSATFAQFRTPSGNIHFVDLEIFELDQPEIFITDLQLIKIEQQSYYLVLGWGTCCGGKHFSVAKIYEIKGEELIETNALFEDATEIYCEANRSQVIQLNYASDTQTLSYFSYAIDPDSGFYLDEQTKVRLKLTQKVFKPLD